MYYLVIYNTCFIAIINKFLFLILGANFKIQPFFFPHKIREGDFTKVMCFVSAEEKAFTFKWYKDHLEIRGDNRIEISHQPDSSFLKIKSVTAQDSGNYTCVALSDHTVLNYTASLVVEGKKNEN